MPQNTGMLEALSKRPADEELLPGVTVADMMAFITLDEVPAGSRYLERTFFSGRDLRLIVYARDVASPTVLFIHGGGWRNGAPEGHLKDCHELAKLGYTTASIEYRLSGEATWPAAYDDVLAALTHLREHAAELGVDPARVALAGGSAGGHLALVTGMRPTPVDVRSIATWFPMTDMSAPGATPWAKECCALMLGDERYTEEASPLTYVRPGIPPVLTMTGSEDPVAPLPMLREFHDALDRAGVVNELIVHPGGTHGFNFHPHRWMECFERHAAWLARWLHN